MHEQTINSPVIAAVKPAAAPSPACRLVQREPVCSLTWRPAAALQLRCSNWKIAVQRFA